MNGVAATATARSGLGTVLCEAASAHRSGAASLDRLGSFALPADLLRRMIEAARPAVASGEPGVATAPAEASHLR
jgi:hypothetical protein